ncbi:unnamed protein product [Prorocentrum cordatum]|uniref:glutathione gamma-glutamylcysteinyltransferase n=1 Tax=Prorocentrum cordatum TaxID=2364126 RepID=A0ABN9U1J3_9DINO|nr:unnamed protein product [Polarella glacialis]
MVLNSLRIDPMRTWKGAWRWFTEQNLGCCAGPEEVRESGLSFDMFNSLAGCNGADSVLHRAPPRGRSSGADQATFEEAFRASVRAISRSQERECIVVCYSREVLGQSGAGHFSPIGGYHEDSDSVLIMDVARFKYPPHWARVSDIVSAMTDVDPDTDRPRGYVHLRLRREHSNDQALPVPLTIPYVPVASGKKLSEGLAAALEAPCPLLEEQGPDGAAAMAVRRWVHAVVAAEPRVLSRLLQVGDEAALREVLTRLSSFQLFGDLCAAYARLQASADEGLGADFPPLRFLAAPGGEAPVVPWPPVSAATADEDLASCGLGPGGCGELWVLLLLLLPEHLRAAVSKELMGPWVAHEMARAVRGPWALPLEALREALAQMLPRPKAKRCLQ